MHSSSGTADGASGAAPCSTRREFVIAGALCATAAIAGTVPHAMSSASAKPSRPLEHLIPQAIGQWRSVPFGDLLIPRGEKFEEKTYDEVVTRYYDSPSAAGVMLLIAYGSAQVGDTELHRPEACYPVAGFKLQRGPSLLLRFPGVDVAARSMTAHATGRTEQLLYWSRVGREFPTSSLAQHWAALRQTLRGSIPDGVLVRVSTIAEDRGAAMGLLEQFAGELLGAGGPDLRLVLTGAA
jgi:EpsI family protein